MADSALSALTASDALTGTELFYSDGFASSVAADVKVTATQIRNFTRAYAKGTITSASQLLDDAVTWNNAATTFTAWKLNVTDTASAASSLLMDLQVGGNSKFGVDKSGNGFAVSSFWTGAAASVSSANYLGPTSIQTYNGGFLGISSTGGAAGTADVRLYRDAANTLAQRNGTNAQAYRAYVTYTDASNGAWVETGAVGSFGYVRGDANGTGSLSGLVISGRNATTNGSIYLRRQYSSATGWLIDGTTGSFLAETDNTYDIGASGANRPRTGYFGTSLVTPVLKTTTALVTAVDGASTAAFTANMVGSTGGPTTAAQNGWVKMQDSTGATVWVPVWK